MFISNKMWFEGVELIVSNEEIKPGDIYIGSRNTTHLLQCKEVKDNGTIVPTTHHYCFNINECYKVLNFV